MKREIKFKFWLGHTKKMTYVHSIIDISHMFWDFTEDIIPLQFTGQIDCNGDEIFEGDIVKTGTDKVMCIGWSDKHASFVIDREGWAFLHYFGEAFDGKDCEVIGNKYENPELLMPACDAQKC